MAAVRIITSTLGLVGGKLPLPWLLSLVAVLFGGIQSWRLEEAKEALEPLRWQIAALERDKELASGRADQATQALKEARAANKALDKAYRAAKEEANRKTLIQARKASEGSVRACRAAYEVIYDSIYR